ncbi:MAG: EamA family transporter [Thermomicrobiales bacterium]
MPIAIVGLLLCSALLHAGWNLLVKRAREKIVFIWLALVVGFVAFSPALAFAARLPSRVWPYVLFSTLFEVAYFFTLTRAYDHGDFSLVYPIARGAAPGLLLLWSALFLNETPRPGGFIGLALVLIGLMIVGGTQWLRGDRRVVSRGSVGLALAVATCISLYSVIDGGAVRFAPPLTYAVVVQGCIALMSAPIVIARYGPRMMAIEWRANWPRILTVGLFSLTTYTLVLFAFAHTRVAYAGAVREVSIVFAALIGWRFLGETFGPLRTVGALLIFIGIFTIALAG